MENRPYKTNSFLYKFLYVTLLYLIQRVPVYARHLSNILKCPFIIIRNNDKILCKHMRNKMLYLQVTRIVLRP